jgi:hypothetical protein
MPFGAVRTRVAQLRSRRFARTNVRMYINRRLRDGSGGFGLRCTNVQKKKRTRTLGGCYSRLFLASFASVLLGARTTSADESPSLVLEPAPAGDRAAFVERAAVRGHLLVAARFAVDYAHAPLVLVDSAQNDDVVVANQTTFHAMASLSLRHRFILALDVPFSYVPSFLGFLVKQKGWEPRLSRRLLGRPRL